MDYFISLLEKIPVKGSVAATWILVVLVFLLTLHIIMPHVPAIIKAWSEHKINTAKAKQKLELDQKRFDERIKKEKSKRRKGSQNS